DALPISRRILNANDNCLSFAYREVGNDAVKRRNVFSLTQNVRQLTQHGIRLAYTADARCPLRAHLRDFGLVGAQGCYCDVIAGFLGVEVGLGDELALIKILRTVVIESLLLEIGLIPC